MPPAPARYVDDVVLRGHGAYRYHSNLVDLDPDAALGDPAALAGWRNATGKLFRDLYDAVPLSAPLDLEVVDERKNGDGQWRLYNNRPPKNSPLHGHEIGGVVAWPANASHRAETVVYIHGHGMSTPGRGRLDSAVANEHIRALLASGRAVWAPDNVFHEPLYGLYAEHDYSIMWAKTALTSRPLVEAAFGLPPARRVLGVAAGGLTGLAMTLADPSIQSLTTSGAFFSLELTRRDYRILGHPFCHDFRRFASYLPLYALAVDRPLHILMGRLDGLWPGPALKAQPEMLFSGTVHGVFTEETIGGALILERLSQAAKSRFRFTVHDRGHIDVEMPSVLDFWDNGDPGGNVRTAR